MRVVRRVLLLDQPQETRFFAFCGAFGIVLAVAYWFASYELAGTALLAAFGLATGTVGAALIAGRPARVEERTAREPDAARVAEAVRVGGAAAGTGDVDRPFADEGGRLPDETLAPLALGLGIALAVTALVFGPWLAIAAVLPLGWGAWTWLTGARSELAATEQDDAAARAAGPDAAGD